MLETVPTTSSSIQTRASSAYSPVLAAGLRRVKLTSRAGGGSAAAASAAKEAGGLGALAELAGIDAAAVPDLVERVARKLRTEPVEDLRLDRVFAETMTVNTASRATMAAVGMTHVRTFLLDRPEPIAGVEQGEVEYALTRDGWSRLRAGGAGTPGGR